MAEIIEATNIEHDPITGDMRTDDNDFTNNPINILFLYVIPQKLGYPLY